MGVATDDLVDAMGFIAGLLVTSALVPQIYRAHRRKSARDLSFSWQDFGTVSMEVMIEVSAKVCVLPNFSPAFWTPPIDLSGLEVTLGVGVGCQLVYLWHYDLYAAFVPLVGELLFITYLAILKIYFHGFRDIWDVTKASPLDIGRNGDSSGRSDAGVREDANVDDFSSGSSTVAHI